MKVRFSIDYFTHLGQKIFICGCVDELGQADQSKAIEMHYVSNSEWAVDIDMLTSGYIEYGYLVKEGNTLIASENGYQHMLKLDENRDFEVYNKWRNNENDQYLQTSAFTDCFTCHAIDRDIIYHTKTIVLQVYCSLVTQNQTVILCGSSHALGRWNEGKALRLQPIGGGIWQISINAEHLDDVQTFKFAIYDNALNKIVDWEEGESRSLDKNEHCRTIVSEMVYNRKSTQWKGAGVAIPVFSLRTENSFGIGEFTDLKKMIDWAAITHQKVIQILPINDTTITYTYTDSYPYNAISTYALHPILLGLHQFPLNNKSLNDQYKKRGAELNELSSVDYENVIAFKWEYLRLLFAEMGKATMQSDSYSLFLNNNGEWLFSYACFSFLRDKYKTTDTAQWDEFCGYNKSKLEQLIYSDKDAQEYIAMVYFVQYLLHKQLSDVKTYAHQNGVILKGDIPIGISRHSVEAWVEPHLFNLDVQTGAPPDDFSITGQNWGFPTYNWGEMEKDGYQWWVKRFSKMSDYFDAYRIDHILGFFRIWEIPNSSVQGLLGYFNPAIPLSRDEICACGLQFDEVRMTNAVIHRHFLHEIFAEYTHEVINTYLYTHDDEYFSLQEYCNTQQKIRGLFGALNNAKSIVLENGLFALCNNVLFVRDRYQPDKFHPRIAGYQTATYKQLSDNQKGAFDWLHEDYFYRRHTQFWKDEAMKKLPTLISSTHMLVCGEDLGMIPQSVPEVMNQLQILSLEIERMPKAFNRLFADLNALPYLSVCSPSTHDMAPIRTWWHENRSSIQIYYNEVLKQNGEAPTDCTTHICEQIVSNQLNAPSMLSILPIQDWLSMDHALRREVHEDERINIPSIPNYYWRYRMHITLESLIRAEHYNAKVKQLIEESGRMQ